MARVRRIRKIKKIRPLRKKKKFRITKHTVGSSKIEKEFGQFLKNLGLDVESQHQILYKFYDFHIKGKKMLIEFQGDYFHCNEKIFKDGPINKIQRDAIKNDRYKRALAAANGYRLLEIWEHDYKTSLIETKKKILDFVNG